MSPKSMASSPSGTAVSQQLTIRDRSHLELQKVTRYSHMFGLYVVPVFHVVGKGKDHVMYFFWSCFTSKNKLLTCILLVDFIM